MAQKNDVAQRIAARVRLTARAERAFGLAATRAVLPQRRELPELTSPAEPLRAKAVTSPVPPAIEPPSAKPTIDLFGDPVNLTVPIAIGEEAFAEPPPSRARRIELLTLLDDTEVKGCTKCPLHENRIHTVFGEGDPAAKLMFIGEGPGENEDLTGRPFVGKAGGLLDKMIAGMGLAREDVYIANVVKCRPPGNRVPTALEVATCTSAHLHKQIEWIRPSVIVTLGLPATRHLLGLKLPMGKMRGKWHSWRGIRLMPTYHPAYLLRAYTAANRRAVWEDLQEVMSVLGLSPRRRS